MSMAAVTVPASDQLWVQGSAAVGQRRVPVVVGEWLVLTWRRLCGRRIGLLERRRLRALLASLRQRRPAALASVDPGLSALGTLQVLAEPGGRRARLVAIQSRPRPRWACDGREKGLLSALLAYPGH